MASFKGQLDAIEEKVKGMPDDAVPPKEVLDMMKPLFVEANKQDAWKSHYSQPPDRFSANYTEEPYEPLYMHTVESVKKLAAALRRNLKGAEGGRRRTKKAIRRRRKMARKMTRKH